MRELDRRAAESTSFKPAASGRSPLSVRWTAVLDPICVVGRGRLGAPLAEALRRAGLVVAGPWGRADRRACAEAALGADADPSLVPLFEALVERTHALATRGEGPAARPTTSAVAGSPS